MPASCNNPTDRSRPALAFRLSARNPLRWVGACGLIPVVAVSGYEPSAHRDSEKEENWRCRLRHTCQEQQALVAPGWLASWLALASHEKTPAMDAPSEETLTLQ